MHFLLFSPTRNARQVVLSLSLFFKKRKEKQKKRQGKKESSLRNFQPCDGFIFIIIRLTILSELPI